MTAAELEALLSGGGESPRLDFKRATRWSKKLIKDIIAMANTQDGGHIVIGVDELPGGAYARTGVPEYMRNTYVPDTMRDQAATYADPHVQFDVFQPQDAANLHYVVIRVQEFADGPVICAKTDSRVKVRRGKVYHRPSAGRPASKAAETAMEMRPIIELAAIKSMRRFQQLGLQVGPAANVVQQVNLDQELEGL